MSAPILLLGCPARFPIILKSMSLYCQSIGAALLYSMMRIEKDRIMDNQLNSSVTEDRRNFLKTCGRFAATVPPAMTILLSTSLSSEAIAASSGGGGGGDRGPRDSGSKPGLDSTPKYGSLDTGIKTVEVPRDKPRT